MSLADNQTLGTTETPATRTRSAAPARPGSNGRPKWALPVGIMVLAIMGWGWIVTANEIPHYILPGARPGSGAVLSTIGAC